MRDWLWACGEAGRTASSCDLGYGEGAGSERLRQVAASYAQRVRAAATSPHQVVVCSGFVQGAALTFAALGRRGHQVVALEDPGHDAIRVLVQRAGLQPVPVPVDDQRMVFSALAATAATVAVLTPAHQTPTGVVLSAARRRELLQWATAADAVVIEDDYDSEFRYDKQPVGCLQGLAPDRVVSIASVSKTLAPAVRLGWFLAPPDLAAAIGQEKLDSDRGSPGLDQLELARLLESGRFDRHLRRMRGVYRDRRTALTDALSQHAPTAQLSGLAAGLHVLLHFPARADEDAIVAAAALRSVGVQGLRRYRFPGSTGPGGLVLGFGDLTESATRRGIARVADLLQPEVDLTEKTRLDFSASPPVPTVRHVPTTGGRPPSRRI
jgi:GntR family transcriptional regulator/MocR family aminotransferase